MKFEQVKGWKMAGKVAAVVALGALASAQSAHTARGESEAKKGQALAEVSLENDIRTPAPARRKIVLERPAEQRRLDLVLKMRARAGADLRAFMPAAEDMEMTITLVHGTPGGLAVIHLDTRAPALRRAGAARIVGLFDEDGQFSVELPAGFRADDVIAHGEDRGLVNLRGGGHAVPASKRPVTDDMDVETTVQQVYQNWARLYAELYTNLQFGKGGMRRLGDQPEIIVTQSLSSGGLSNDAGHAQPGSGVDDDVTPGEGELEVFIDLPNPVGGRRAFGKIALERPRKPSLGGGHVRPGTSVDDDTQIGEDDGEDVIVDLPNPVRGSGALGKIRLQRPATKPKPAQHEDNVLQRKL